MPIVRLDAIGENKYEDESEINDHTAKKNRMDLDNDDGDEKVYESPQHRDASFPKQSSLSDLLSQNKDLM